MTVDVVQSGGLGEKMKESGVLKEFSPGYYGICTIGGMLSAGSTHLAITPLDVLKVNMQVKFRINILYFLRV